MNTQPHARSGHHGVLASLALVGCTSLLIAWLFSFALPIAVGNAGVVAPRIKVAVTDAESGSPVVGVSVWAKRENGSGPRYFGAEDSPESQAVTDSKGLATVTLNDAGVWLVGVAPQPGEPRAPSRRGLENGGVFAPLAYRVSVGDGGEGVELHIRAQRAEYVRGKVEAVGAKVDRWEGTLVEIRGTLPGGHVVSLTQETFLDGSFVLGPVLPGPYSVTVSPSYVAGLGDSLPEQFTVPTEGLRLKVSPSRAVWGNVNDPSGLPVDGALVRAFAAGGAPGTYYVTVSGSGGAFEFPLMNHNSHALVATLNGDMIGLTRIASGRGNEGSSVLKLEPAAIINLDFGSHVQFPVYVRVGHLREDGELDVTREYVSERSPIVALAPVGECVIEVRETESGLARVTRVSTQPGPIRLNIQ